MRSRVRTHVDLKRTHDLLEQLASVDPLTGIANRRRFDTALAEEWRRNGRAGRWLSLALVDVDHFKQFNDRHGHLAGDDCLRRIAEWLSRSSRRAGDLLARYGGEEFGLILPDVDASMMHGVVRTLLAGVAVPHIDGAPSVAAELVTVSIGAISVIPPDGTSVVQALAAADDLLYEAKAEGRNRCIHLDGQSYEKTTIFPVVS